MDEEKSIATVNPAKITRDGGKQRVINKEEMKLYKVIHTLMDNSPGEGKSDGVATHPVPQPSARKRTMHHDQERLITAVHRG